MKEFLSENDIKFIYFDITESLLHLKKFLAIRDNRPEFDTIKEAGRLGLPALYVDDKDIYFSQEEINIEDLK